MDISLVSVADPDLELRGRGGGGGVLDLLALLAFFPSVISSFFSQNKGGAWVPRAPPLDRPLSLTLSDVVTNNILKPADLQ